MMNKDNELPDDYCKDTMNSIIRTIPDNIISTTDWDLLEEFAPKLFNTFHSPNKLEESMQGLARAIMLYRGGPAMNKGFLKHFDWLNKHSHQDNLETLKKKAEDMLKIIGRSQKVDVLRAYGQQDLNFELRNDLSLTLEAVIFSPESFMPQDKKEKKKIISVTKNNIEEYLRGLDLIRKDSEIKEFMKHLKTNTHTPKKSN